MVSDIDIYRTANVLVKRHGEGAPIQAAMRGDELLEQGDVDGYPVFKQVLKATEELLCEERLPGGPVPRGPIMAEHFLTGPHAGLDTPASTRNPLALACINPRAARRRHDIASPCHTVGRSKPRFGYARRRRRSQTRAIKRLIAWKILVRAAVRSTRKSQAACRSRRR